jgi:hypothetical protein
MALCPRRQGLVAGVPVDQKREVVPSEVDRRGALRRALAPEGLMAVAGEQSFQVFLASRGLIGACALLPGRNADAPGPRHRRVGAVVGALFVAALLLATPACFLHLPFRHHAKEGPPPPAAGQSNTEEAKTEGAKTEEAKTQETPTPKKGTSKSKNIAKEEPTEAAEGAPAASPTGFIGFEQFQLSHSHVGTVIIADTDVGYTFNEHISGDFGLPVLFTRSKFSPVSTKDYQWYALFGAPYIDIRYTGVHNGWKYTSVLTGTIPVSNEDQIYTTGRPGVDLYTHAERGKIEGVTPFINIGLSNGAIDRFIMPRPYSEARPYQTLGALADGEVGAEYKIDYGPAKGVGIGMSYYGLEPVGPQKVFSRLVVPYSSLASTTYQFGEHYRYWDTTFETNKPIQAEGSQALTGLATGSYDGCTVTNTVITCKALSSIARDNGYSGWIDVSLPRWSFVTLQLGYVHSIHYALDTYTVTLSFDAKRLARTLLSPR